MAITKSDRKSPSGPVSNLVGTVSATYTAIADGATQEQTVALVGVKPGDVLIAQLNTGDLTSGLCVASARVAAADSIHIGVGNFSGGSVTPGALTFDVIAFRL